MKYYYFLMLPLLLLSCSDEEKAASLMNSAEELISTGNYDAAIVALSEALSETSDFEGDVYCKRAEVYCKKGEYIKAEQDIIAAIDEDDEKGLYYKVYGDICFAQQQWDLAVENYDSAEDLDYTQPELLRMRGLSNVKLDKTNKALSDLTEFYKSSPDSIQIAEICGNMYLSKKDYKGAHTYFNAYYSYNDTNNDVIEKYSLCASRIGNYTEARILTDTLIRREVISSNIFEINGEALLRSNQTDKAIKVLSSSINLDNNNDRALELRSEAFKIIGDTENEIRDLYRYKTLRFNNAGFFWNYFALPLCYLFLIIIIYSLFRKVRERYVFSTPAAYSMCVFWLLGAHYAYLRSSMRSLLVFVLALFLGFASFEIYAYYEYPSQLLSAITDNLPALILLSILALWFLYDIITIDYQVYRAQTNSRRCKDYLESRLNAVENTNTQIIQNLEQYKLPTPEQILSLCRKCSKDDPEKIRHYFIDGLNVLFDSKISHRKVRKERNVAKNLAKNVEKINKSNSSEINALRNAVLRIVKCNIHIAEDSMILTKCALHTLDKIKTIEQKSLLVKANSIQLTAPVQKTYSISTPQEQQKDLFTKQALSEAATQAMNVMEICKAIPSPHLAAIVAGTAVLMAAPLMVDAYCTTEIDKAILQQNKELGQLVDIINKLDAIKRTLLKVSTCNCELIKFNRLITTFYGENIQDALYCKPSYSNYCKYRIKKEYQFTDKNKADMNNLMQGISQMNSVIEFLNENLLRK